MVCRTRGGGITQRTTTLEGGSASKSGVRQREASAFADGFAAHMLFIASSFWSFEMLLLHLFNGSLGTSFAALDQCPVATLNFEICLLTAFITSIEHTRRSTSARREDTRAHISPPRY
jgi:hypothetical protein